MESILQSYWVNLNQTSSVFEISRSGLCECLGPQDELEMGVVHAFTFGNGKVSSDSLSDWFSSATFFVNESSNKKGGVSASFPITLIKSFWECCQSLCSQSQPALPPRRTRHVIAFGGTLDTTAARRRSAHDQRLGRHTRNALLTH